MENIKIARKKLYINVGQQITEFRTKAGTTQEQLAEAAQIRPVIMERIERGAYSKLSSSMLDRIAKAMGLVVELTLQQPRIAKMKNRTPV